MSTHPNGSSLCLSCGLCCDGSLFERARLQPGEESFAAELGLTVLSVSGQKPRFELPCHLFQGCCSIYDQTRPRVCGAFKCKLLIKYENGAITLADGLGKIRHARAMQSELTGLLPAAADGTISLAKVKRQMQALSQVSADERRANIQFLLLAAKYEMLLRTHFLRQSSKKALPDMEQSVP
jgi:uncharacterized protein